MIIAIIIGVWFFRLAKEAELNKALWAAVGVLSFILGQFVLAFILALFMPELFDGMGAEIIVGIIGGAIGVGVSYYILQNAIKSAPKKMSKSELIDDEL